MKKPFERVLLHIGPPKSGTTSIQHFLFANRAALQARGFYVPLASSRGYQHIELPLCFRRHSKQLELLTGVSGGEIDALREIMTNAFAAEIAGVGGGDTLLISSEHLFGSSSPVVDAYRRFFAPYAERFESLMYLRRQDRWIASSVLQRRKSGLRFDADLRVGADTGFGSPPQFERVVRLWDAGSDRCHIRRFDAEFLFRRSLLEDFCNLIGCEQAGLNMKDAYNRAPLQEQIELIDALGDALALIPYDKQIAYRSRFQPLCGEVLGGSPFEFPRAAARATFEAYAPINKWLCETRDPGGPPFFFDDDFQRLPDRGPQRPRIHPRTVACSFGGDRDTASRARSSRSCRSAGRLARGRRRACHLLFHRAPHRRDRAGAGGAAERRDRGTAPREVDRPGQVREASPRSIKKGRKENEYFYSIIVMLHKMNMS